MTKAENIAQKAAELMKNDAVLITAADIKNGVVQKIQVYFWSDAPICGEATDVFFAHAMETVCAYIGRVRAGKLTLVVTPYPHHGVGNFLGGETWRTSSRHDTDAVNFCGHTLSVYAEVMEETCLKYGIPCLNLHKNFAFDHRLHTLDGCHPNEEGHRLLAETIANKLKSLMDPKS